MWLHRYSLSTAPVTTLSQQLIEWRALQPGWWGLSYYDNSSEDVRMARVIRKACQLRCGELIAQPAPSTSVADLLAAGESASVEFKSTSRTDLHQGRNPTKRCFWQP
jgi:hypothetical protein